MKIVLIYKFNYRVDQLLVTSCIFLNCCHIESKEVQYLLKFVCVFIPINIDSFRPRYIFIEVLNYSCNENRK